MVEESEIEEHIHQKRNAVALISDHAESEFKRHTKKLLNSVDIQDHFTHVGIISRKSRGILEPRLNLVFCSESEVLYFPTNLTFRTRVTNSLYQEVGNPDIICHIPTALIKKEMKKYREWKKGPMKHEWKINFLYFSRNFDLSQCYAEVQNAIIQYKRRNMYLKWPLRSF